MGLRPTEGPWGERSVYCGDEWRGGTLATCQAITGMVVAAKRKHLLPLVVESESHLFQVEGEATVGGWGGRDRQDKQGVMSKAWKQSFDLGCFNFLVISVAQ